MASASKILLRRVMSDRVSNGKVMINCMNRISNSGSLLTKVVVYHTTTFPPKPLTDAVDKRVAYPLAAYSSSSGTFRWIDKWLLEMKLKYKTSPWNMVDIMIAIKELHALFSLEENYVRIGKIVKEYAWVLTKVENAVSTMSPPFKEEIHKLFQSLPKVVFEALIGHFVPLGFKKLLEIVGFGGGGHTTSLLMESGSLDIEALFKCLNVQTVLIIPIPKHVVINTWFKNESGDEKKATAGSEKKFGGAAADEKERAAPESGDEKKAAAGSEKKYGGAASDEKEAPTEATAADSQKSAPEAASAGFDKAPPKGASLESVSEATVAAGFDKAPPEVFPERAALDSDM